MRTGQHNIRIKSHSILLAFFLVLCWSSVSKAQKKKRWQVKPSLAFYEQYSDNLELTCDSCGDAVSGFQTQIIPTFSFLLPSKRRQIRIDYSMRMDHRRRSDDVNKTLYWIDLNTYLGHEISPRTSYEMTLNYDITYTNPDLGSPFVDAFSALTRANVLEFTPLSVRYRLGKKTLTKVSASYVGVDYAEDYDPDDPEKIGGIDSSEVAGAGYIERKFGTRMTINLGVSYSSKTFANETGYDEMEIPVGIDLNLTYFKLSMTPTYYTRTVHSEDEVGLGDSDSKILVGLGFDLGGKLFKLRKTTFKINIGQDVNDDMYGHAYVATIVKLKAFHVLKKADFYNEIKWGNNEYLVNEDTINYYGLVLSSRWFITKKKTLEGKLDYTIYSYDGVQTGAYAILIAELDYGYKMRDWLYVGVGLGRKQSSSDIDEGNYAEHYLGLFAKADW